MGRRVDRFYAVTLTSLYRISWQEGTRAVARKIALHRESKRPLFSILKKGEFVGICPSRIFTYDNIQFRSNHPTPRLPLERVACSDLCCWTSDLIALFLRKKEAEKCFRAMSATNLDIRWEKQTLETAQAIGPNHPVFVFTESWVQQFSH